MVPFEVSDAVSVIPWLAVGASYLDQDFDRPGSCRQPTLKPKDRRLMKYMGAFLAPQLIHRRYAVSVVT